ncbi:MAG: alpha/beta hydrolase domain-containing protein [Alphaproteobacteria bacterium]
MPLVELKITHSERFASGMEFSDVGTYELLKGVAHYEIDPKHPHNSGIVDLSLAPTNQRGQVEFEADFVMLHPTEPRRGNGALLFDVVNRGTKTALTFNGVRHTYDPMMPVDPGNGYLMRNGYTVVFGGWQADVPSIDGLIGMRGPEALDTDGNPITGRINWWFQEQEAQASQWQLLSHKGHLAHPPADPDEEDAQLFVKDHPNECGTIIPREKWEFARKGTEAQEPNPSHIFFESGFQPGRMYELVYTTQGSQIVGLGFPAMRDMVCFLKYGEKKQGNPCSGSIDRAHAFGHSQSGRFLRNYLHVGNNTDELGRKALDGVFSHAAGGMKGEFNLRFGQPSRDVSYVLPGSFPCSDSTQIDPVTGNQGSLLEQINKNGNLPKIIFSNTSAEYWRGDAALTHTELSVQIDLPEDTNYVRRYHYSGTQHGIGAIPLQFIRSTDGWYGQQRFSCMDYSPLHRAILHNLDKWVNEEIPPPPSSHPRHADGTAKETKEVIQNFAKLPGLTLPKRLARVQRLDYGPKLEQGQTLTLPATIGEQFPAFVSAVNEDLNEVAGIRLPELSVPVASYTGWNLRHPSRGNSDLFLGISGGLAGATIPFSATRQQRELNGDPRPSIEERYPSKEDYLQRVREAAKSLHTSAYLLDEDIERIVVRASQIWDAFTKNHTNADSEDE